jgi:two-component system, LuxR family, secretion system response regulator SsrB
MVSKDVNNHSFNKKLLESLGFPVVTPTMLDNEALNAQIRELKPVIIIMEADFYECCTPYKMGLLRKDFKDIRLVAVSIGKYPDDLAMSFKSNGVNSYVTTTDGYDKIFKSLSEIARGRDFFSPVIAKRIAIRKEAPDGAGNITDRLIQVIKLICNGFRDKAIAKKLAISRSTLDTLKTKIFKFLNIDCSLEMIRVALTLNIVSLEEMYFYPDDFTVNPKPKNFRKRKNKQE